MTTRLRDINGDRLTLRRGTSPTLIFAVVEAGTTTPKSLIGATEVSLAIGAKNSAAARTLLITLEEGITHDGAGGLVTVTLTAAQTEALPVGTSWAELWITDSTGQRDLAGAGACAVVDTLITVP